MGEITAAGGASEAWQHSVREHVQTAWDALDHAQLILYRLHKDTRDEQIGDFKRRFSRATDALIRLAVDELYAPYEMPAVSEDDPDEATAAP